MYAEVIGDPIGHSLSPVIHRHWLAPLDITGDFRATRVEPGGLPAFLDARSRDRDWRGCSVTLPHKEKIAPLLAGVDDAAARIGAVNCVYRRDEGLFGTNTDVEGIGQALVGVEVTDRKAVVIGAGGAARATLAWLARHALADTVLLVRDPSRARMLIGPGIRAAPIHAASAEIAGARLVVNASPLGMTGSPAMPSSILDALASAPEATVMDMVYNPLDTELLAAARATGLKAVDGLHMLVGQARRAFSHFFGAEPPPADATLHALLTGRR